MNISSEINKFNIKFKQTIVHFKTMIHPELSKNKSILPYTQNCKLFIYCFLCISIIGTSSLVGGLNNS